MSELLARLANVLATQQTGVIDPTLVYCWPTVYDVGPTVNQRWANYHVCWARTNNALDVLKAC